jgi:hypothetical protein
VAEPGHRVGGAAWMGCIGATLVQRSLRCWGGGDQPGVRCRPTRPLAMPQPQPAGQTPQLPLGAQAGPHTEGVRCTHALRLRHDEGAPCVSRTPGSYAKGGEAARNSTFTRAAPVRTISSRRAAS